MENMRICGGCDRCCFTHTVKSFDETVTEGMKWCRYCERGIGCRVYESVLKPHGCTRYRCAWLEGKAGDDLYPKACNVVIDFDALTVGETVFLMEAAAGAFEQPCVKEFEAEQLRLGKFLARRYADGRRVLVVPPMRDVSDDYVSRMQTAKITVTFAS